MPGPTKKEQKIAEHFQGASECMRKIDQYRASIADFELAIAARKKQAQEHLDEIRRLQQG